MEEAFTEWILLLFYFGFFCGDGFRLCEYLFNLVSNILSFIKHENSGISTRYTMVEERRGEKRRREL